MANNNTGQYYTLEEEGENPFAEQENPFKAEAMFGKGYEAELKAPQIQPTVQPPTQPEPTPTTTNLQFQKFDLPADPRTPPPSTPTNPFATGPSSPILEPQPEESTYKPSPDAYFQPEPQAEQKPKTVRFWHIEYHKWMFNVDTKEVGLRVVRGFTPFPATFFQLMGNNPDLYGPFWIATTLVFIMAATGNVANYLTALRKHEVDNWKYEFKNMPFAAGAIYGFLTVIPLLLWAVLRYYKTGMTLIQIVCVYGYSFIIYLPVSIICIIPLDALRWGMIALAALLSTSFVISNFFVALRQQQQLKIGILMLAVMALLHIGFALMTGIYFFKYHTPAQTVTPPPS